MKRRIILGSIVLAVIFVSASGASAIDRDTVIVIAKSYAEHRWECASANTRASCSSSYRSDYSPGTYTGVAYDWGGYKTLAEYDAELAKGFGAGSHSKHGVLSCTTGVDCSGYVSKCWQESRYTTSTIDKISTIISKNSIKKGDIFNKAGSHVVLFSHFTQSGAPVYYEASGSASKVRLNSSGGWSYLSGYTPRRYKNIAESINQTVCGEPIAISKFPFKDLKDTTESPCDKFDAYSCAPTTSERGPEYIYKFEANFPGNLTASVSSGPGVDIDIHLLAALDAKSCIARNDKKISLYIEPGLYYLVADTYVGSSGREYPGPFQLDVDFVPDASSDTDAGEEDVLIPDASLPENGELKGVVYEDKGVGEADMSVRLAGATVTIFETGDKTTAASSTGSWQFSLPPDTYTVKASMVGYKDNQRTCEVTPSSVTWCSIGLKNSITDEIIVIPSFPYTDTRNTKNSSSDRFDSYSCAPSTGEKGPEYIYAFEIAKSGKLTATVTDGSGVDIDIHLLTALDPNSCLARNDTTFTMSLTAGYYYLVADTYSNSSGTEFAGEYTLKVSFAPDPEPSEDKGEAVGTMWNTYYYVSYENDYSGTNDTNLYDSNCKVIATVPSKFSDAVCIEGTGKLKDGRVINYAKSCNCGRTCPTGGIVCYSVLDTNKYPWGMGAASRPLVPLRSWAVDKSIIPIGTILYAEEWDGVEMPVKDGLGGFTHDGCFVADDVGGAITGLHYDFFAGTKSMYLALEAIYKTRSNFTVYKNPGRCSYLSP